MSHLPTDTFTCNRCMVVISRTSFRLKGQCCRLDRDTRNTLRDFEEMPSVNKEQRVIRFSTAQIITEHHSLFLHRITEKFLLAEKATCHFCQVRYSLRWSRENKVQKRFWNLSAYMSSSSQ